jgi:hypothetical protein
VTVRVIGYTPAEVYVWLSDTDPEPLVSVTVPVVVLPSPQFQLAVCVSRTPGSVKLAEAVVEELTWMGLTEAVMAPGVGATLLTVISVLACPGAPWLSVIVTTT